MEAKRKPTWFSPEKAKKRLLEDRDPEFGDQLAAVVDRAVSRIQRLGREDVLVQKDELQRARLESRETTGVPAASAGLIRYFFQARNGPSGEYIEIQRKTRVMAGTRKISRLESAKHFDRIPLRLTAGNQSPEEAGTVVRIDRTPTLPPTKSRNSSSR